MSRPDDYDLYIEEGMKAEESRYHEEMQYYRDKYLENIKEKLLLLDGLLVKAITMDNEIYVGSLINGDESVYIVTCGGDWEIAKEDIKSIEKEEE